MCYNIPIQVFGDMAITIITKRMLRGEEIQVVGSRRFTLKSFCPETSVARSCAVVMVKLRVRESEVREQEVEAFTIYL